MHEAHFSIGLCSAHYFFLFFFTFLPFRASSLFAASAERRMVGQKNAKGNRFWSIAIEIFQHFARFVSILPVHLCLNIILLGLVNGNLSLKLAQELRSFTSIDYHQRLRFVNLFAIFFVFMLQICEFV